MSLFRVNKVNWIIVDAYNKVWTVSRASHPTFESALMRAFNKSRRN